MTRLFERKGGEAFGRLFPLKVPAIWYGFAFIWKPLFTYIGIAGIAILGIRVWPGMVVDNFFGGNWENLEHLAKNMPFIIGIAIVEETAWMKFCVTRLQDRYKALPACLLAGTAWGLWYLPMLLIGEGVRWVPMAHVHAEHDRIDHPAELDLQHDPQRYYPLDHADHQQLRLLHATRTSGPMEW